MSAVGVGAPTRRAARSCAVIDLFATCITAAQVGPHLSHGLRRRLWGFVGGGGGD